MEMGNIFYLLFYLQRSHMNTTKHMHATQKVHIIELFILCWFVQRIQQFYRICVNTHPLKCSIYILPHTCFLKWRFLLWSSSFDLKLPLSGNCLFLSSYMAKSTKHLIFSTCNLNNSLCLWSPKSRHFSISFMHTKVSCWSCRRWPISLCNNQNM